MKIAYSSKSLESYLNLNSHQALDYDSIIKIHVSCKNLRKFDNNECESNPVCILFSQKNNKFIEEDRTEVIQNNSNPDFTKKFKTYYTFDSNQPLRFDIYNCVINQSIFKINDFIGYCETSVCYIISNLDQEIVFDLHNDKNQEKNGQIILKCQQTKKSNLFLKGELQVKKLKKMKTFAKNNPFYEISKPSESGINIPVYRSKVIKKCQSCKFKEFLIPLHIICQHKIDEPMTITFYDYQYKKAPKFIGKYESTIRDYIDQIKTPFDLNCEIPGKKVGNFCFKKLEIIEIPTFVDYLKSGISLNMITAFNFTYSKGDQKIFNAFHCMSKDLNQLSEYEKSVMSIGSVLINYIKEKQFAVYGYGAKINKKVNHCFPLTFNSDKTEVNSVQSIIDVYNETAKKVSYTQSTHFAEIISEAIKIAKKKYDESHTYSILLLLTDCLNNDMEETINQIAKASDAPLSIIIIGVGSTNFVNMHKLDEGNLSKSSNGKHIKRNIVQFVQFNEFKNNSPIKLENEVLDKIPFQIYQFCSSHGYNPEMQKNVKSCFYKFL